MLFWETGAVGEQATDNGAGSSFFRMAPMGAGLGRSAIGFVRDQLAPQLKANHPLRYAVTYVDDAYGRAVGLGAVDEAKASKQDVVGVFPYDVYHLDAAALVRRIAATSPDVLVVAAYLDDGVALRKATVDQHVPLLASIGTSSSYCMPEFAQRLGPAAVGLFASDKPDGDVVREDALTSDAQTLLRWARGRFRQRFGSSLSAPALAGFANTWALVHDVLPASAGLRPADVAAAALRVKLPKGSLVNGAGIDLAGPGQPDAGENRASASVIEEWVDPRTMTVVWPPMFAEHPIANIAIQR
jgi:ABC-type branched-subunit amino acid transport system substrate-binding protein